MKKLICVFLIIMIVGCATLGVCAYSIDDEFMDNKVLIVLTPAASENDPILTPEDFEGLGVIEVERSTYDGATYHTYSLTLDKNDKQNVLDVVAELEKLEWIYGASPNVETTPSKDEAEFTDELLKAINTYNDINVSKDEVSLKYTFMFSEDKYLVRYSVAGYSYSADIVKLRLGDFLLTTARPVPQVYKNGELFEIEDAYNKGYLNEFDMYDLVSCEYVNVKFVGDIFGDADMDGEMSVLDATCIQMYIAGLLDESKIDLKNSNVDFDEEVSVLDATAIQLKLVGLE